MKVMTMNLNETPTRDQLRALLADADDEAGHHILWVDTNGKVNLTLLDDLVVLTKFSTAYPSVRLRFEAYCAGNGYVGLEAANDDEHVDLCFSRLCAAWQNADGARPGEIFVD